MVFLEYVVHHWITCVVRLWKKYHYRIISRVILQCPALVLKEPKRELFNTNQQISNIVSLTWACVKDLAATRRATNSLLSIGTFTGPGWCWVITHHLRMWPLNCNRMNTVLLSLQKKSWALRTRSDSMNNHGGQKMQILCSLELKTCRLPVDQNNEKFMFNSSKAIFTD